MATHGVLIAALLCSCPPIVCSPLLARLCWRGSGWQVLQPQHHRLTPAAGLQCPGTRWQTTCAAGALCTSQSQHRHPCKSRTNADSCPLLLCQLPLLPLQRGPPTLSLVTAPSAMAQERIAARLLTHCPHCNWHRAGRTSEAAVSRRMTAPAQRPAVDMLQGHAGQWLPLSCLQWPGTGWPTCCWPCV